MLPICGSIYCYRTEAIVDCYYSQKLAGNVRVGGGGGGGAPLPSPCGTVPPVTSEVCHGQYVLIGPSEESES